MSAVVVVAVCLATVPWWSCRRTAGALSRDRDAGRRGATGRLRDRQHGRPTGGADQPDADLVLEVVAVALAAGAPVPRALATVGAAWPGAVGAALVRAAGALALGSSWSAAWAGSSGAARAVADALEPSAATGSSPVPLLRSAAAAARRRRRAAGRTATGRVGVWLVLPLGLCFLPAFLLLGVVPVVLSIAGRLLG